MVFGGSTPVLSPLFWNNLDILNVVGGKYLEMRYIDMWEEGFGPGHDFDYLRGLEQKSP